MSTLSSPRIMVWSHPSHIALVREAAEESRAIIAGCGAADTRSSAELAAALDAERLDDLRLAVGEGGFDLLLITSDVPLTHDTRAAVIESGILAVTTLPQPDSFGAVIDRAESCVGHVAPLCRHGAGVIEAKSFLDEFGPAAAVHLRMQCAQGEGTLFARLFDAVDVLTLLLGECEQVDAALSGPDAYPADSLSAMAGHLTANLRFSDDRSASLSILSRAPKWGRTFLVAASGVVLHVDDAMCIVESASGEKDEEVVAPKKARGRGPARRRASTSTERGDVSPGRLIGRRIARLLDRSAPAEPPVNHARILAVCEAARISCRTRNSESALRLLEMVE